MTYLARAGWRMPSLLLVDFGAPPVRPAWHQRLRSIFRRPTQIESRFEALCRALQPAWAASIDFTGDFRFERYADKVIEVRARDYTDPTFQDLLRARKDRVFLYTNGGRVPSALLAEPNLRMLHVHPGVVPAVRGSDGLFWSVLTRGRPGASCFLMDPGIDTGAVLLTKEFPLPDFKDALGESAIDEALLYRALLFAYDPHLRGAVLAELVEKANGDLRNAVGTAQIDGPNEAYAWMHPRLRRAAYARMGLRAA